jgi:hypothetical protein
MSTKLSEMKTARGVLDLVAFWGGNENGSMIQVTQGFGGTEMGILGEPGHIQLTKAEAAELAARLGKWSSE